MELFFCDTQTLNDDEYDYYKSIVSTQTLKKISSMHSDTDKKTTVCGEAMAKIVIGGKLHLSPENVEIIKNAKGKPYVIAPIYFNWSHSQTYTAVALSENEIGVDIEKLREPDFKMTKKFCTRREEDFVKDAETFFKIWTLKESYLKCIGVGIAGGLKSIEFYIKADSIVSSVKDFNFKIITDYPDCIISVCEKIQPHFSK